MKPLNKTDAPSFRWMEEPVLEIVDFYYHPELLETIVGWHLVEWPSDSTAKRTENLSAHLVSDTIPSTYVALLNREPIGAVSLVSYKRLGGIEGSLWMANLLVQDSFRGQGVGRMLVRYAETRALQLGSGKFFLSAKKDLQAFYQSLGWLVVSERDLRGEALVIMSKELA